MVGRVFLLLGIVALAVAPARGAGLRVHVEDRDGNPLGGVVVVAEPADGRRVPSGTPGRARMNQRNLSFEPEVLVVRTGTPVLFPNEDAVKHHVYSFSPAKTFELSLYSGSEHPPETFDHPGLVTLGCNIHDSMIGYVYVTDAPYFGKTDPMGGLELHGIDPGDYEVKLWHPRIRSGEPESERRVAIEGDTDVRFGLTKKLKPKRSNNPTSRWSGY